jgi:cytochrome c oxidase subunit 2
MEHEMGGVPLFPDQGSTVAPQVDALFFALLSMSGVITLIILTAIVYFAAKYRRGANVRRGPANISSARIELPLIGGMFVLAMGTFTWGAISYFEIERPPANAIEIAVVGKQWMWKFQHPEGRREIDELHVPVGQPIKLLMTSEDVIHSLYVPEFRIKQDVLPGRYTTIWFQATKAGEYRLLCAEYCGTDHAVMGGRVIAMEPADYQTWLSRAAAGPPSAETLAGSGQQLFTSLGCSGCHRMDGSGAGPSLVGVYGKPTPVENSQTVMADEGYIRDSILLPQQHVVAGYQPIMPSFKGQVSEEQLLQLIAYIKSLADNQGQPAPTDIKS